MKKQFSLIVLTILIASFFFIQSIPNVSAVPSCACIGVESGDGSPPQSCTTSVSNCGVGNQLINQCGAIQPSYTCSGSCYCVETVSTCFATESACQATLTPLGCAASGRDNLNWCVLASPNCWKPTVKGCQFGACSPDQCSGVTTWTNYPFTGSYSCSGVGDGSENGLCSTLPTSNNNCNALSTSVCTAAKASPSCTIENCGATPTTCHYTNAGALQWDTSLPSESACTDGQDNDCDGKVDCVAGNQDPDCGCLSAPTAPKLKFRQGTTASYAGIIGSNGVFDIKGVLSQSQSSITSSTADFVIRNNAGVIVALLDYNGNLKLKGTSSTRTQAQLNAYLTDGQTQFVVKTSSGSVVAVIDLNGNLYLLGGLRQSQTNPQ